MRPPWAMLAEHVAKGGRVARHFQADVESLFHAKLRAARRPACRRFTFNVNVAPICLASAEAIFVHVGHDDISGPGMAHDRGGHDADRPGAGDQHVLAEHGKREGRVDGVAEGIEDRGHVAIDVVPMMPDIGHRQRRDIRRTLPAD